MKRIGFALMLICITVCIASCYYVMPGPPIDNDQSGIILVESYQRMKSLLEASGSGEYYINNVYACYLVIY